MKEELKRIDVVRIKMIKESSITYGRSAMKNPSEVAKVIREFLGSRDRECFGVICLDTKNKITNISIVSIGTLNSAIANPREIYKTAILSNANSIIVFHNHPSGDPEPSQSDIDLTKRVAEAGFIISINLLDHIIIADDVYLSMKEKQLL